MAGPDKSALLVDYGSLRQSLAAAGGKAATGLGQYVRDWVATLESGSLIEPGGTPRMIATRQCYAEPGLVGQHSAAFVAAGFDMIDVGSAEGEGRADVALAIDAMEVASRTDLAEVILLTAAPGLAHLVKRIKLRGRRVVVYAEEANAAAYGEIADGIVNAADFVDVLVRAAAVPEKGRITLPADRNRIEAFAREVNAATNIPMFSPKTFAELFRLLCEEVNSNGYHFQSTAKNVAERLTGSGRSVTSRQVVFVVKGLALKGHVFSTTDTPERLAEVFREQARYLIASAGITLDAERERLLAAWIAAPGTKAAAIVPAPAKAREAAPAPAKPKEAAAKPAAPQGAEAARTVRRPGRPETPAEAAPPPPPARLPERPKSNALPPRAPAEPPAPKATPAEVRVAAVAARIAASARLRPPAKPAAAPPRPPPAKPEGEPRPKSDAIESSILAAIAEAVDVLVEDSGARKAELAPPETGQRPPRQAERTPPRASAPPAPPPPEPEPEPEPAPESGEGADGGDIGDEIQRIVASYNRNRTEKERGE